MAAALLLFVVLVFAGLLALLSLRGSGRVRLATDPRCGKCGYGVRGISSLYCPECGADLREVGIVPAAATIGAATGRRAWPWAAVVAAVVLALLLLGCLTSMIARPVPSFHVAPSPRPATPAPPAPAAAPPAPQPVPPAVAPPRPVERPATAPPDDLTPSR